MPLPFLLAWRYTRQTRAELSISAMARICFWAIAIAACALALIVSIMRGFEIETRATFENVHPPLIIHANGKPLAVDAITRVLKNEFNISKIAPSAQQFVAIVTDDDQTSLENIVSLTAIDPTAQHAVTGLGNKIKLPHKMAVQQLVHSNHLLLSTATAKQLGVRVGQRVRLLCAQPNNRTRQRITINEESAIVAGLFETGLHEFDASTAFCSFDLLATLCEHAQPTHIGIRPPAEMPAIKDKLQKRLDLEVISWQQLDPALFSALALETWVTFFVIALIVLVASMNIISLLFMQITHKQRDIAALTALGMTKKQIQLLFFSFGLGIGVRAAFVGLAGAWIAGLLLQKYPFIHLPDVYYVSHLPVHLSVATFAYVFALIIALVAIASVIPLRRVGKIKVSTILRLEAA